MTTSESLASALQQALDNTSAEIACVYWQPSEQVSFKGRERMDSRERVSLERMLRYRVWQWMRQNHVRLDHRIVQPRNLVLPHDSRPMLLLPLMRRAQELAGFALLVLPEQPNESSQRIFDALDTLGEQAVAAHLRGRDEKSGLLSRDAFLLELERLCDEQPSLAMRSCVLRIQFDTVSQLYEHHCTEAASMAFSQQLAILETRLRQRDVIARWSESEIIVLLRQCELPNAERLIIQFQQLMSGYCFVNDDASWEGMVQMRVMALHDEDLLEDFLATPIPVLPSRCQSRAEQDTVVVAMPTHREGRDETISDAEVPARSEANVISLHRARRADSDTETLLDRPVGVDVLPPQSERRVEEMRCHPCVLLHDDRAIGFLVRSLEEHGVQLDSPNDVEQGFREPNLSRETREAAQMLDAVIRQMVAQGVFRYQRDLDMMFQWPDALQTSSGLSWLLETARQLQVPPTQLVPMVSATRLMADPRRTFPIILRAWREGLQVMLDVSDADDYGKFLLELLPVNHIYLSSLVLRRAVQDELRQERLIDLLDTCRIRGITSLCGNLRSAQDRQLCMALGIDYGFGAQVGRSQSLAALSA